MPITILTPDYELTVKEAYYAFGAEAPVGVDTIKSVGLAEQRATGTIYASGKVLKAISRLNSSQLTVGATALPQIFKRRALGRTQSTNGGFAASTSDDIPVEFAFGYASEYSSGLQKFIWYPRCTLVTADTNVETKKDGAEDPNSSYVILAMPYATGNCIEIAYDQSEVVAGKVPLTAAEFFAAVITSLDAAIVDTEAAGTTPDALSYTIAPVDGATLAKTGNVVLTFNNAIVSGFVSVIASVTGEIFACVQTWDAARKVLTLTHASAFAATTAYIVAVNGMTDVYGQVLANSSSDFTTLA